MAMRSLSPNRIVQKLREHRQCVIVLARQSARKAIKAQLRAEGLKLSQFSAKDISIRADAYFDIHRERLIAGAEQIVATSPYFARWRLPDCANIETNAQSEKPPISTTSPLQISGAK